MNNSINLLSIFKKSFILYRAVLPLFVILGLIYGFANVVPGFVLNLLRINSVELTVLLTLLLNSWMAIVMIYAADSIYSKREVDFKVIISSPKKIYWSYVSVVIAYLLVVIFGAFLFIIPGLYCAVIFMFANIIVLLEKKDFIECFRQSFAYVQGFFLSVLSFLMVNTVFYLIPMIILSPFKNVSVGFQSSVNVVMMVFIMPYLTLAQIGLYRKIKELTADS
ncbi:MAG: hypothetical protein KC733_09365 [Candidatus Omnitrophica bacterium]|nr:hypothetical protein [Candidatus Omnitrophota bacterium]